MGLWLEQGKLSLREDLPIPSPKEGEALIRLLSAGICSTDHHLAAGMYDYEGILGHEFVGQVEKGPEDLIGKRVVGEINLPCGKCELCHANLSRHCKNRTVLGILKQPGAFAEYLTLPTDNLHLVPDSVSDEDAVFTEPIAAALEILEQIQIQPTQRVIVVGDGKLGQLISQVLNLTGCDLLVLGRHEKKLSHLERLGIRTTTNTDLDGRTFDKSVECTGNSAGFEIARTALKPTGTLVLKSTYPGKLNIDATFLTVDEITIVGSRCGPFAPALNLIQNSKIDLSYLKEKTYPLKSALDAFDYSKQKGVLKVLLKA